MCKMCRFRLSCTWAKSHLGLCSPLIRFIVSNDSISRQQRPRSDCAYAQSDLGLRCPCMPIRHILTWFGSYDKCSRNLNSEILVSNKTNMIIKIPSLVQNGKYLPSVSSPLNLISKLTLKAPITTTADNTFFFFFFFSEKISHDIWCESSVKLTIHKKCQDLLS